MYVSKLESHPTVLPIQAISEYIFLDSKKKMWIFKMIWIIVHLCFWEIPKVYVMLANFLNLLILFSHTPCKLKFNMILNIWIKFKCSSKYVNFLPITNFKHPQIIPNYYFATVLTVELEMANIGASNLGTEHK